MRLTLADAKIRYGEIENGVWASEPLCCIIYKVPDDISPYLMNSATNQPTRHIYCNKDMVNALDQAFVAVRDRELLHELKTFDGCFVIRDVRAEPGHPSCHSYALAIDLNAATNKLGSDGDMSDEFAQCFIDAGFTWGKTFSRKDPMHFSFAWE